VSPALASARVALPFTRREHEIAQLVSNGMSNREIARASETSSHSLLEPSNQVVANRKGAATTLAGVGPPP